MRGLLGGQQQRARNNPSQHKAPPGIEPFIAQSASQQTNPRAKILPCVEEPHFLLIEQPRRIHFSMHLQHVRTSAHRTYINEFLI